jgi:hypothetical protein
VVTGVPHPYGLVIVGIHMYWTDWQTYALHRADKINGTENTIIRGKLEGLMDVRSVQVRSTKTSSRNITNTACFNLMQTQLFGSTRSLLKMHLIK